jgi:Ni,Fe-hydrogenase III small subunit
MRIWPADSIRKRLVTTKFPRKPNETISPWSTLPVKIGNEEVDCPTGAIEDGEVSMEKCISCGYCVNAFKPSLKTHNYKTVNKIDGLRRSLKIYIVDSGTCGACNTELHAIANPHYDASRLGIFFTNTPKQADAIAIMGVYTKKMEEPVRAAINAMSQPGIVILFGTCAISGGIIGKGLEDIIRHDLVIGGCPPDPFVILEALQKARGGKL